MNASQSQVQTVIAHQQELSRIAGRDSFAWADCGVSHGTMTKLRNVGLIDKTGDRWTFTAVADDLLTEYVDDAVTVTVGQSALSDFSRA